MAIPMIETRQLNTLMDLTEPRSTPSELATIATLNSHIDLLKKVEEQPSISATTSHTWSVAK